MNVCALAAICIGVQGAKTAPVVVYDNTTKSLDNYFMLMPAWMNESVEAGDEIWLAGSNRVITDMTILMTFVGSKAGTFDVRVRFRRMGTRNKPGAIFYDGGLVRELKIREGINPYTFKIPKVKVPDRFVWTIQISNRKGAVGEFGPSYFHPPKIGRSQDFLWQEGGGEWTPYSWGAEPVANFAARFVAVSK